MTPDPADQRTVRPWVTKLARLMDTKFRIPVIGWRFGWDPIIGLLPVAGDTVTLLIGATMLLEARRLHLGPGVQLRMAGNLLIDWLLGLVPGVDLILDTVFRAHARNAAILTDAAEQRRTSSDR